MSNLIKDLIATAFGVAKDNGWAKPLTYNSIVPGAAYDPTISTKPAPTVNPFTCLGAIDTAPIQLENADQTTTVALQIYVLQASLKVLPKADDTVSDGVRTYTVKKVDQDAANATWRLTAVI